MGIERLRKRLSIRSRQGLHARPAALFVQLANRFKSSVRVRKGRKEVNGKSIMGVLTLAASQGSTVQVIVEGSDAKEAMHALEQLLSHDELPAVVHLVKHKAPSRAHSHGPSS
jgi:phosphotransferase system HPr (HPr) family protein